MTFVTNDQGTTMRLSDIGPDYRSTSPATESPRHHPSKLTLLRKNEDEPLAGQKLDVGALASEPVTIDATWSRCLAGRAPAGGPARPALRRPRGDSAGSTSPVVPTRTRRPRRAGSRPGGGLTPVGIADATGEPSR
jgi:hypothetical protein